MARLKTIQPIYEDVHCLVCGSTDDELLYQRPDYKITTSSHAVVFDLTYRICRDCGLVFMSPQLHAECRDQFYENFTLYESYEKETDLEKIGKVLLPFEKKFYDEGVASGSAVLDLGCGNAVDLYYLARRRDCRVLGIELSRYYCEYGRNVLNIPVERIAIEKFDAPASSYDVVISKSVFEHLQDPIAMFVKVNRLLRPGGHFLLLVPSVYTPSLTIRDIFSSHNFLFSPVSIRNIIKNTGFKIIACEEDDFLFYLLCKTADRVEYARDGIVSDYRDVKAHLDAFLSNYLIFRRNIGDKLAAIFKDWEKNNSKTAVWGAGEHTCSLLSDFNFDAGRVMFLLDSDDSLWGQTRYGFKIKPPSALKETEIDEVLISSMAYEAEIAGTIRSIDESISIRTLYS